MKAPHLPIVVMVLVSGPSYGIAQATDCSTLDVDVYIRHQTSLLVLESNLGIEEEELVKLRPLYYHSDQRWRFQPSSKIGLFNIINQHNTSALALGLSQNYDPETDSFNATLDILKDDITQQWFVHGDGTIVNGAANNHVLKVNDNSLVPYNHLIVAPRMGDIGEKFILDF